MSRIIYQCPQCGEEWSERHCPKCAEEREAHSSAPTGLAALSNAVMLDVIRERVRAVDFQGNLAKQLGISAQYLCDVLGGRREVSAHLAEKLGYKRVVSFVPLNSD